MRRKLGLTAAIIAAVAMVGYAQAKPDLSGTWTLDTSQSEAGQGGGRGRGMMAGPITIKQTADTLSIERQGMNGPMTTTYKLDGTETEVPAGRGGTGKAKAHWDGDKIVVEVTSEGQNGAMTRTTSYSLGPDGTLVMEATGMGGQTRKLVYKKST